jgi:hypothetical protein
MPQRWHATHVQRTLSSPVKLAAGKEVTWASMHASTSPSMHASDAILRSYEATAPIGSEALPFSLHAVRWDGGHVRIGKGSRESHVPFWRACEFEISGPIHSALPSVVVG